MSGEPQAEDAYCPTCDRAFASGTELCPDDGTKLVRLHPSIDPLLGRTLDNRYTLRELIGEGGMGSVYKAWQHAVGREVAVKVIRAAASGDHAAITKRFLREAKLTSRLSQPNSVVVLDFGQTEEGLLYLVMELLRGRTLQQVMQEPLPLERTLRIVGQICDALEAAHKLEIVHRDLKPSNVLILDEPAGRDFVKVLDFGLARSLAGDDVTATQSDMIVGTPAYISPEAAQGLPLDARADLYSVGVMLYEMVAGVRPFEADDPRTMIVHHIAVAPKPLPPEVPAVLTEVILRLLAKEPAARIASAALLRETLLAVGERAAPAPSKSGSRAGDLALDQTQTPTPTGLEATAAAVALDPTLAASALRPTPQPSAVKPPPGHDETMDAPVKAAPRPAAAVSPALPAAAVSGAVPVAAVTSSAALPAPRRPWPLLMAAVAVVALALLWWLRPWNRPPQGEPAHPVVAAPLDAALAATPADAAVTGHAATPDAAVAAHAAVPDAALPEVTIVVDAVPASATLSGSGVASCPSPCRLTRRQGATLHLTAAAPHYTAQPVELSFRSDDARHVVLQRASGGRPPPAKATPDAGVKPPEPHHGLGIDVTNPVK